MVANWTFLTSRARAPPCIAHDPEVRARLRGQPGITQRSAYGTVTNPAEAGYEVNQKNRRRNRYQIGAHLPLPEPGRVLDGVVIHRGDVDDGVGREQQPHLESRPRRASNDVPQSDGGRRVSGGRGDAGYRGSGWGCRRAHWRAGGSRAGRCPPGAAAGMPACRPKGFAVGPDLTDPTEVLAAAFGDLASPLIAGGVLRPEPHSGRHNGGRRAAGAGARDVNFGLIFV
jgi:hypothetical protein